MRSLDRIADALERVDPATRTLALLAGIAAAAGPRRTRPLAGFAYGVFLSRAQGAGMARVNDGASTAARRGAESHASHERRLDDLEAVVGGQYGGPPEREAIRRVVERGTGIVNLGRPR
jgi:hypothetical protein